MSYSKVLRNIIANANITQEELSNKCKELAAPISRGQINKILNGKAAAPEEKVSRAIAKICKVDDRELVIEGYLEKAPKEIVEFFNIFQDNLMKISLIFIENVLDKKNMEILKELYRKETKAQMILEILHNKKEIFLDKETFEIIKKNKNINIMFKDFQYLEMEDNSMENKIPKGSKIKLEVREKYKNGDIVLVKIKGQKKPIIRIIFFMGRDICLYAFNNEYKSLYLKNGNYQILSAVSSIETKL